MDSAYKIMVYGFDRKTHMCTQRPADRNFCRNDIEPEMTWWTLNQHAHNKTTLILNDDFKP